MIIQPSAIAPKMLKWLHKLAIILPLVCIAAPAIAAVDAPVQSALALHASGKAPEAFALLSPLEAERAGDPDFDYALGLAAADSGNIPRAIAALQRVLAVQPNNAQARAEIARVYAMAGDFETAKAEFNTVIADPSLPDPVRQQLGGLSRTYGQAMRGGPSRMSGFFEVEAGDDSNVNAATSATSIILPVFAFLGPATLSGGATQQSESFAQVQAGVSGETPLSRQTKLFGSALGLWRDASNGSTFDQGAITGTLGFAHTSAAGNVMSLSGQGQQFWLASDPYRVSLGVIGQYTHRLTAGDALSFAVQYASIGYETDTLRDGDRYTGTVSYAGKQLYLALGAGKEEIRDNGSRHLGYSLATAQAGFEQPLSDRFSLSAGLSGEERNYDGADPLFARGRRDTQLDASLTLRAMIGQGVSVRSRITYTDNASNLALYDYDRFNASISLRKEF